MPVEQPEDREMHRVEAVEEILGGPAADKAPLPVIEVQEGKGAGYPRRPTQERDARKSLDHGLLRQQIQQQDQQKAFPAVIRVELHRDDCQADQQQGTAQRHVPELAQAPDPQPAQQQGKEHILPLEGEGAAVEEIIGNLGEQREEEEIQGIALFAACVAKALRQKKTEDGKGDAPKAPQQHIGREAYIKKRKEVRIQQRPEANGGMVHQHGRHGQQLQRAAAERPKAPGEYIGLLHASPPQRMINTL